MIETLRCPACYAAYGLRPERIHAGIRRAQCARCPEIFSIEDVVARLLAAPTEAIPTDAGEPEPLVASLQDGEPTMAIAVLPPVEEEPFLLEEPAELAAISPEDLLPAPTQPAALDFLEPLEPVAPLQAPQDAPSLTLHDLEGSDEEILDKTLLMEVIPAAPQEPEGFSSAKDAISRILGGLDAPASHAHPHAGRMSKSQGVDMEATLSALDHSLGATPPTPVPAEPKTVPAPAPASPGTATTVRISIEDIRAAIESVPVATDAPAPVTVPQPVAPAPAPLPVAETPAAGQDPNLLKVQVGNEVFTNVTVEQLTLWIEQGRILENHQVARQFSDHWIDAVKVPALRPVFDRVRRARIEAGAPQSVLDTPQKKSLFGGLFGR